MRTITQLDTPYEWCATGHRPPKLFAVNPYSRNNFNRLVSFAKVRLLKHKVESMVTGGALGWDLAIGHACFELKIPYIVAIPFIGQESKWPESAQELYYNVVYGATACITLAEHYEAKCLQERNIWMVDKTKQVLTLYDGSSGGTSNCITYALEQNRRVLNVWKGWEKMRAQSDV